MELYDGIPDEAKDRIFQMFQRLHPVGGFEGSGIGLAFTRRVIERHDGRIWCASELGVGTTFFFTLLGMPYAPVGRAWTRPSPGTSGC